MVRYFHPRQNYLYKKTYTDNLLYTKKYLDFELNKSLRRSWTAAAEKFATHYLHLKKKKVAKALEIEKRMVKEMDGWRRKVRVDDTKGGIHKMRAAEAYGRRKMTELLGGSHNYGKLQYLKKRFFSKNLRRLKRMPASSHRGR